MSILCYKCAVLREGVDLAREGDKHMLQLELKVLLIWCCSL